MSRAVMFEAFGGIENLELRDVDEPHAGAGEVRVKVAASGLNPMDPMILQDQNLAQMFGISVPSGFGSDYAGVIDEIGDGVTDFAVGDRVYGGALGKAIADYVVVRVDGDIWRTPNGISDEIASTLTVPGRTAAAALDVLNLHAGDTVLIGGAAGGVGVFAVQLAKRAGIRVIGTASESTFDFLRGLGAEPVAYGEGLAGRVRVLAPDGITAATDLFGTEVAEAALELGVPADRISTIAAHTQPVEGAHATGAVEAKPDALTDITTAIIAGEIQVPIAARFPIEQTADAAELQMGRHVHGKIVITL